MADSCSGAGGALPITDDSTLRRVRKGFQQRLSAEMAAAAGQDLPMPTAALVECYALLERLQDGSGPAGSHPGMDAAVGICTNAVSACATEVIMAFLNEHTHWPFHAV